MNNYIYIISSLPALSRDWKGSDGFSSDEIIAEIKARCSQKDVERIDFFLKGFDSDSLDKEFYEEAAKQKSEFVREYFKFDMNVRNVKARYLNGAFGRPADQDVITLDGQDQGFEEEPAVQAVLNTRDILAREKGLDDIMWNKIYELTLFHYLDMEIYL